jgi:hypothetical protein
VGGDDVGQWAEDHGFRLPPDAPEVLDFYAERSPIFLAAAFDADAAAERGQAIGDGTPIHLTIPTDQPWVPLRILSLGKAAEERVDADVYLLTDGAPTILPAASTGSGLDLRHTAPASRSLLDDLRSDRGMEWVPERAWLMKLSVAAPAGDLRYDLAVSTSAARPSRVAAGLERPATSAADTAELTTAGPSGDAAMSLVGALLIITVVGGAGAYVRRGRRMAQDPGHDPTPGH